MDIPHLSKSEILQPMVPIPDLEEQQKIAKLIRGQALQIQALQKHKFELENLKTQVVNSLLSGQNDLPLPEETRELVSAWSKSI